MSLSRRSFVGASAVALADAGAQAQAAARLPARGEYLIRGAHILTMDPALGDLTAGDIHIRDGAIIVVAAKVNAPKASVIAAPGMFALPGLIDTHWHMWNTMLRSMAGDEPAR